MKETWEEKKEKKSYPSLGIIRLDYNYPPANGDIDCPNSFSYDVYYKVIPGLTYEMCQSGTMTNEVEMDFIKSIQWLVEEKNVSGITGDCGFMMYYQSLARKITHKPVFMSSLVQLPAVTSAYNSKEQVIIMTGNKTSFLPMRDLIKDECRVDTYDKRYHIVGCEDVPGFEAVALGKRVDVKKVEPGIVKKAVDSLKQFPESRVFLLE